MRTFVTSSGRLRLFVTVVLALSLVPLPGIASLAPSGVRPLGSVSLQTTEPSMMRVAGADRLGTALAISQIGWDSSDTVLLAAKDNFPDALAGGPLAAALDAPILLTDPSELTAEVADEIVRLSATNVIVLGGPTAVSPAVLADLIDAGIAPEAIERIGGDDRYETSTLVARRVIELVGGCDTVVVTTGENFPDALGASGMAGFFGWPILFVRPDAVPPSTAALLAELAPEDAPVSPIATLVLGGESAVGADVLAVLPAATRIGGADRYETAGLIAEWAFSRGASYDHVYLATGLDFPDALALAPLAARGGFPVVFTRPDALPAATDDFFMSHCSAIVDVTVVGGALAVSPDVEAAVAYAATEIANADAQEIDPATASLLETMTPGGDLVFSGDSSQLDGLVDGAVLSSEPTTSNPDGFFRKVTGVVDSGGTVTVQTVQATLADVLVKGSFDVTGTPDEIPPALPPAVDISAGTGFSLAVMADGTLWGWGTNTEGQLGLGYADGTSVNKMTRIGDDTDWRAASAGWSYAFGIKQDGSLWAWGNNSNGRLGFDASVTQLNEPTLVSDAAWSQVVAYQGHAAGIREDGTLWAWGWNEHGQLGIGDKVNPWAMIQVGTDTDWATVDVGEIHTVALKTDGSLWGLGNNFWGQLGLGATIETLNPARIGTGLYKSVAAGHRQTLAIDLDGKLWATGYNVLGSLGDGTQAGKTTLVQVGSDTDWSTVYAEGYASMALREDRTRWAWGKDLADGLGLETPGDRLVPTKGSEDFKWMQLDMQMAGVLGTDMRGQQWAAGDNQWGQLADGTFVTRAALEPLIADEASLRTLPEGDFTGEPDVTPAGMSPAGEVAPEEYIGRWWEGFVIRYYPDLNDWTFESWALQNPSVYYGRYLRFDGHAKVNFSFYMSGSFDLDGMRDMGMYLAVDEGLSLYVDTTKYGAYSGSILMWPIPKMHLAVVGFMAGPVPVWFNVDMVVLTGLDGYFNAPAVHFRQEGDRTIGFEWDRYYGFNQVNYGSNDSYCYAPSPLGTMSVKFWTSAELQTMMYGIIGPFVKFTGFGEVEANTAWDPWWKLELGLDGEVGAKLDFFDSINETWSITHPLIRWTVAKAPGPFPY